MSGHSKWSTIKRQKQVTDSERGQLFTRLAHAITICVRETGNPDPETNFRLRLVVEKAKLANMPKANVARAISRAEGLDTSPRLKNVIYEGFGPGGAAIIVRCVTDNTNRTAAEIKNAFAKHGGSLGGSGSVAYLFSQVGKLQLPKQVGYDKMLEFTLAAGGEDLILSGDEFIVFTKPQDLNLVKSEFEKLGFLPTNTELTFRPLTSVAPANPELLKKIRELLEVLKDMPFVQDVCVNISNSGIHKQS